MKMQSILVVKGASNYGVVLQFADEMIQEWKKDCIVDVLDGSTFEQYEQKKQEIMRGAVYDMVFSFNALAVEEEPELMEYLLSAGAVYVTQLLDHPLHHHTRLQRLCKEKSVVFVPDYNHLEYIRRYYPNICCSAFLPHGGSVCAVKQPYSRRETAVLFMGSYTSSQVIRERLKEKGEFTGILQEELMHQLEQHSGWTIEQAFSHMIEKYQMEEPAEDIPNDLAALADADYYIRSLYREKVLQTILNAGIAVEVYGDNWEQFSCQGREYLHIHPPCDFQAALERMGNSKIVLNVMPWFKAGSHERVFDALCCGAIALTDRSAYLSSLKRQEGIVMYELSDIERLPDKIREILADDSESAHQAELGCQNCREAHLWKERARSVKDYLEQQSVLQILGTEK